MRDFLAKHFSRPALHERMQAVQLRLQNMVKNKKDGETNNDNEDTNNEDISTETQSENQIPTKTKMKQGFNDFLCGYRDFLLLGSGIKYAVGFIIGGMFLSLINHFTSAFITPWLGVIFGERNIATLFFTINGSQFPYGLFIDTLITFLTMTLVLYFAVLLPSKWLTKKITDKQESIQTNCMYCCSIISRKAVRCPFCTSVLEAVLEIDNSENMHTINDHKSLTKSGIENYDSE